MKYYLIKANDKQKTKFVGEYYFDLAQEPIELTEEELNNIFKEAHLGISETYGSAQEYRKRMKPVEKIRKVLDNE